MQLAHNITDAIIYFFALCKVFPHYTNSFSSAVGWASATWVSSHNVSRLVTRKQNFVHLFLCKPRITWNGIELMDMTWDDVCQWTEMSERIDCPVQKYVCPFFCCVQMKSESLLFFEYRYTKGWSCKSLIRHMLYGVDFSHILPHLFLRRCL